MSGNRERGRDGGERDRENEREKEKEKESGRQRDRMRERKYFTRTFSLLKMNCLDRQVYKDTSEHQEGAVLKSSRSKEESKKKRNWKDI